MKLYIDFKTKLKTKTKIRFEKDLHKLISGTIF